LTEHTQTPFIAANVLKSWLRAVGVESEYRSSNEPVVVVWDRAFTPNPEILSRNKALALAAFWEVTDALGLSRQQPFDRGIEPVDATGAMEKTFYKKDAFVAAIRPTDFRRSPDPTPSQWQRYGRIMKRACSHFLYSKRATCIANGLEFEDILQFGRCYIVNFCNKYEMALVDVSDNERLFSSYVSQRLFGDLLRVLVKAQPGDTLEHTWLQLDEDLTDASHLFKAEVLTRDEEMEWAQEHLERRLLALDHGHLILALAGARSSPVPGVGQAATRYMAKHLKGCGPCRLHKDEHFPETNALGAQEQGVDLGKGHSP
jgi:hypothetical protein